MSRFITLLIFHSFICFLVGFDLAGGKSIFWLIYGGIGILWGGWLLIFNFYEAKCKNSTSKES